MIDASKYEILYCDKSGKYAPEQVGGIRTKEITAGDTLEIEAYPLLKNAAPEARKEARRRESTAWMAAANRRRRDKQITRLLETNFTEADFHLTLTYDYGFDVRSEMRREDVMRGYEDARLPLTDEDVRRDLRNFFRRMKRRMQRAGSDPAELKYLYVIESTYEPRPEEFDALPAHYHIHIVIGGLGALSRDDAEKTWGRGYANCDRLDFSNNGLKALAKYLGKGKKFGQRWGHSIGLKLPKIRKTDRAISRRRAERIAQECQSYGREIFEKIYPDYALTEIEVKYSAFTAGAYIYARMRRRKGRKKGEAK